MRRGGNLRSPGVIGIQDAEVFGRLVLKHPRFGGGIVFERRIPIQMIRRDVENRADPGMKCFNRFQLKTRDLGHDKIPAAPVQRGQGRLG